MTPNFVDQSIKALVAACNTATASSIDLLRTVYPNLPIIGVMATRSTLASARFQALLAARAGNPATAWQTPSNAVPALNTLQK